MRKNLFNLLVILALGIVTFLMAWFLAVVVGPKLDRVWCAKEEDRVANYPDTHYSEDYQEVCIEKSV